MSYLLLLLLALLAVAAAAYVAARRASRRTGLPSGQLIYSDTGYAVGDVAPTTLDEQGRKQEQPLFSRRYGLVGRPDYLVRTDEGIIPVEAKSSMCPRNGRPYDSHLMQLAAYCLLVEDALNEAVPYGIVRYRDAELKIDYTLELKEELLSRLEEMREANLAVEVHRSHEDVRRCQGCSLREICIEALS